MSYGRLGVAELAATTHTVVYTAPASCYYAEVDVLVLNPENADAVVQVAISTQVSTPNNNEFIEKGVVVPSEGGSLERHRLRLSPGEKVFAYSSIANVVVRVQGTEVVELR